MTYCTNKYWVRSLSETVYGEVCSSNVRVSLIFFCITETELLSDTTSNKIKDRYNE